MNKIKKIIVLFLILPLTLQAQSFKGLDKSPMDQAKYPTSNRITEKVAIVTYSRPQLNGRSFKDIVPENNVFKHSISQLMNLLPNQKNQKKLRNIVLDEMDKLISSSESKVHRSTGCYYVLIALVEVSPECADQMPWLIQV